MDLSYLRFEHDASAAILPPDLGVLLVGVAARQAASPTAVVQNRLAPSIALESVFRPATGAFDSGVAQRIFEWRQE